MVMQKSPGAPLSSARNPAKGPAAVPSREAVRPAAGKPQTPAASARDASGLLSSIHGVRAVTDAEFEKFQKLIYDECGIFLKPAKKALLLSRLGKRIRDLGLSTFDAYYEYVTKGPGKLKEFEEMIDAVTTNKTSFFRENHHFEFLRSTLIPDLRAARGLSGPGKGLRVWSAGCSTGEEPYTLAMCLNEWLQPGETYALQATDISPSVLAHARAGIYGEDRVADIPKDLLRKYMVKQDGKYKVQPRLQANLTFRQLNFKSPFADGRTTFDLILCRNVIIYFDRDAQCQLMDKFHRCLNPGGYLFLGHSESLNGVYDKLRFVRASVYRKD